MYQYYANNEFYKLITSGWILLILATNTDERTVALYCSDCDSDIIAVVNICKIGLELLRFRS